MDVVSNSIIQSQCMEGLDFPFRRDDCESISKANKIENLLIHAISPYLGLQCVCKLFHTLFKKIPVTANAGKDGCMLIFTSESQYPLFWSTFFFGILFLLFVFSTNIFLVYLISSTPYFLCSFIIGVFVFCTPCFLCSFIIAFSCCNLSFLFVNFF